MEATTAEMMTTHRAANLVPPQTMMRRHMALAVEDKTQKTPFPGLERTMIPQLMARGPREDPATSALPILEEMDLMGRLVLPITTALEQTILRRRMAARTAQIVTMNTEITPTRGVTPRLESSCKY